MRATAHRGFIRVVVPRLVRAIGRWGNGLKRIDLADPRLVTLRASDRAEAACLLAAIMRTSTPGWGAGRSSREEHTVAAAELPAARLPGGKPETPKDAGEGT
jgi:hypothetical protein